jgi:hypothetical protein
LLHENNKLRTGDTEEAHVHLPAIMQKLESRSRLAFEPAARPVGAGDDERRVLKGAKPRPPERVDAPLL